MVAKLTFTFGATTAQRNGTPGVVSSGRVGSIDQVVHRTPIPQRGTLIGGRHQQPPGRFGQLTQPQ